MSARVSGWTSARTSGGLLVLLLSAGIVACGGGGPEADGVSTDPRLEGRSLAAPPAPEVGEWWAVEVDPVLVGATFQTRLVVTDRAEGRAGIGMPPEDFSHDFLVLHIPVLGDLDLATFAWRVMWDDFEALRFPLEPGRSWTADFHGRDVEASVTRVEGDRAFITMTGEGERIELVYDARMGMITEFREEALKLGFRVTGHGFDYTGPVIALSGIELGFMQGGPSESAGPHDAHGGGGGVTGGAATGAAGAAQTAEAGDGPGHSSATLEVTTPGSHGSLSLVVWNAGFEDQAGSYRITVTAPDGTIFEEIFELAPGAASVNVTSFGHDAVQGTWRLDFHRGGPARLLVELFTYDRRELVLGG